MLEKHAENDKDRTVLIVAPPHIRRTAEFEWPAATVLLPLAGTIGRRFDHIIMLWRPTAAIEHQWVNECLLTRLSGDGVMRYLC